LWDAVQDEMLPGGSLKLEEKQHEPIIRMLFQSVPGARAETIQISVIFRGPLGDGLCNLCEHRDFNC